MFKDERLLAAGKARAKIAEIERQAVNNLPEWPEYLASLSDEKRESAMSAVTDRSEFNLWCALRVTLPTTSLNSKSCLARATIGPAPSARHCRQQVP
jgi:hypothetical protein